MLASDIMTAPVVTVGPDATVTRIARLLLECKISAVPVIAGGKLVGIVSEADVIAKQGRTVGEIMTRDVITAREDDSLESIAQLMAQHRIKRVLVMRGDSVAGLVSRADIVRALAGA